MSQIDKLMIAYIEAIIDGMTHRELVSFMFDKLYDDFSTYSISRLITEISEYHPDLLDLYDINK